MLAAEVAAVVEVLKASCGATEVSTIFIPLQTLPTVWWLTADMQSRQRTPCP